jgi:hypothetical protein
VSELSLDYDEGHALARHLDGVCVAQLVWSRTSRPPTDRVRRMSP